MEPDAFLDRITRRLGGARGRTVAPRGIPPALREAVPIPRDPGVLASRFVVELERVGGRVIRAASGDAASAALRDLIVEVGATRLVSSDRPEFGRLPVAWLWDELGCATTAGVGPVAFRARCAAAQVGVTAVGAAIAATGTILLTAAPSRPREASLLPTVHVPIVFESQLVPHLGDAMKIALAGGTPPSQVLFVTGPSRTSDIENDLTIGVHGPAAVVVILVDDGARGA